jgi:hypothetical protein
MRPSVLPLLLICFCLTLNAQTQAPAQTDPSPSLQDTIKWIEDKVQTSGGYQYHLEMLWRNGQVTNSYGTYKYDSIGFDSSVCSVAVRSSLGRYPFTYSIFLPRIRPGSITTGQRETHKFPVGEASSIIYTYTPEKHYVITAEPLENDVPVMDNKTWETDGGIALFTFTELSTANRVATALNHAVELCKANAKPEPF